MENRRSVDYSLPLKNRDLIFNVMLAFHGHLLLADFMQNWEQKKYTESTLVAVKFNIHLVKVPLGELVLTLNLSFHCDRYNHFSF